MATILAQDVSAGGRAQAGEILEQAQFQLAVDIGARLTPDGTARMSEIEAALFLPALQAVHAQIERLLAKRASTQWLPGLAEVEARLRSALQSANDWTAGPA